MATTDYREAKRTKETIAQLWMAVIVVGIIALASAGLAGYHEYRYHAGQVMSPRAAEQAGEDMVLNFRRGMEKAKAKLAAEWQAGEPAREEARKKADERFAAQRAELDAQFEELEKLRRGQKRAKEQPVGRDDKPGDNLSEKLLNKSPGGN